MVTLGLSTHGSFLFTILFKSGAYWPIVGKLEMHPCVPFCSGAPQYFLVHPSVHRAHRLKSTELVSYIITR